MTRTNAVSERTRAERGFGVPASERVGVRGRSPRIKNDAQRVVWEAVAGH
jgi:hypothetical protein